MNRLFNFITTTFKRYDCGCCFMLSHNYVTAVVYYVFLYHFVWEIGAQPAKIDPCTHAL